MCPLGSVTVSPLNEGVCLSEARTPFCRLQACANLLRILLRLPHGVYYEGLPGGFHEQTHHVPVVSGVAEEGGTSM